MRGASPKQNGFLVGPLVLIQLGVVVGLAVLHGDASRQDGGHIVADRLALGLLLPLLLHLPQLDTWKNKPISTPRARLQTRNGPPPPKSVKCVDS